jgi:hypothetical protein
MSRESNGKQRTATTAATGNTIVFNRDLCRKSAHDPTEKILNCNGEKATFCVRTVLRRAACSNRPDVCGCEANAMCIRRRRSANGSKRRATVATTEFMIDGYGRKRTCDCPVLVRFQTEQVPAVLSLDWVTYDERQRQVSIPDHLRFYAICRFVARFNKPVESSAGSQTQRLSVHNNRKKGLDKTR